MRIWRRTLRHDHVKYDLLVVPYYYFALVALRIIVMSMSVCLSVCLSILYGLEVYGNTYVSYLDKLTTLNNKILRILQKKGRCCNDCLYMQYNTLPPCQLFNNQIPSLVHKMVYSPHSVPLIFWNYFTPNTCIHSYNTRHNKLYLSQVNFSFGGRLLKFKGSQLWNRLPKDRTDITSLRLFKKKIKVLLDI